MKRLRVFVVSDSVGETGDQVAKAVISQFRPGLENTVIRRFPHIQSEELIRKIVCLAEKQQAVIVYTLVRQEMRSLLHELCEQEKVHAIDILGPALKTMATFMEEIPLEAPGIVHKLDDDYFKKIEAIEFAVKYDDGRDPRGLLQADIVLVGVSRTSKTPLSQYLAHKRYKVANVPLVPEVEPPEELLKIDPKKCFGLIISPDKLNSIRKERLMTLGLNDDAIYAQHKRILEEIQHFEKIVGKIGCKVIDVTNKAVEETANVIIEYISTCK
ncbi:MULTISPECIES: pyruvate, water dikinase regulatory protein [unclassified Lysinibacillus]|uniref:pyruvate, water dikinase regulatory protein n=1 Tax=unclassified Lysinibacillus TaxID=2636778 RepID=UPI002553D554|nr:MULTISPECIES: pyruvate, water dikinase regulatory protein [unclassified Lysinibacillus]MDM5249296.1 pyruvate, water dikinase regulatory protein [Lysinibacillus sp. G4S2]